MVQCLGRSGPGLQLGTRRQLARTGRAADSAIGAVRRHEVFLRFPTERNRPTLYHGRDLRVSRELIDAGPVVALLVSGTDIAMDPAE